MTFYLHIDESGPFDEGFNNKKVESVVGGVCSTMTDDQWDQKHRDHLAKWKQDGGYEFLYPEHYHCGPLIQDNIPGCQAGKLQREAFLDSLFAHVVGRSQFAFASRNLDKAFNYSPQTTYVVNLIAAVRLAFQTLATQAQAEAIDAVHINVAQRSIKETMQDGVGDYMEKMFLFVVEQIQVGDNPGAELARSLKRRDALMLEYGRADLLGGLIAADIACFGVRGNYRIAGSESGRILECHPDREVLLGDYVAFNRQFRNRAIQDGRYAYALELVCASSSERDAILREAAPVLTAFERTDDSRSLRREADALLAFSDRGAAAWLGIALWGLHMAMTQGLLATMVADTAPADLRGTAFGMFNLVSGVALLVASGLAGLLWDRLGASATFGAGIRFATLALAGVLVQSARHGRTPKPPVPQG